MNNHARTSKNSTQLTRKNSQEAEFRSGQVIIMNTERKQGPVIKNKSNSPRDQRKPKQQDVPSPQRVSQHFIDSLIKISKE